MKDSIFDKIYIKFNHVFVRRIKKTRYKSYKKNLLQINQNQNFTYGLNTTEIRNQKIIVSLTSFEPRFETIIPCLKSLLNQSVKPDRIFVYLECSEDKITAEMKNLEQFGITYVCNVEDLKPHKKYFFVMQTFPEDLIITVDDDVIYPGNLIENLLQTHKKFPDCVCARRVHKIKRRFDGTLHNYVNWFFNYEKKDKPSFDLISTGIGGVLYPPHCLCKKAFDKDLIKKLCLNADDIWLKFMENLNGTKVVWSKCTCPEPVEIKDSQRITLNKMNVKKNYNDVYISAMEQEFCITVDNKKLSESHTHSDS